MHDEPHPPPSWNDWLHVVLNGLFVAGGLLMLPSERDVAIVTLAFFGTGLAVSLWRVVTAFRLRRQVFDDVGVVGGVPIRASRRIIFAISLWLTVLGVVLFAFGHDYPLVFRIIAVFMSLAGAGATAYMLLGGGTHGYLQFDSDALTIGEKNWRARVPWNSMAHAAESELYGNPAVILWVADEDVVIEPPSHRESALHTIAKTRALYSGASFVLPAFRYEIDAPLLLAAVERYRNDETARAELGRRALAP